MSCITTALCHAVITCYMSGSRVSQLYWTTTANAHLLFTAG